MSFCQSPSRLLNPSEIPNAAARSRASSCLSAESPPAAVRPARAAAIGHRVSERHLQFLKRRSGLCEGRFDLRMRATRPPVRGERLPVQRMTGAQIGYAMAGNLVWLRHPSARLPRALSRLLSSGRASFWAMINSSSVCRLLSSRPASSAPRSQTAGCPAPGRRSNGHRGVAGGPVADDSLGHIAQIGGYCDDQAASRGVGGRPGKQQALHRTEALHGNALLADVKIGLLQCRIVKTTGRGACQPRRAHPATTRTGIRARDTAPARSAVLRTPPGEEGASVAGLKVRQCRTRRPGAVGTRGSVQFCRAFGQVAIRRQDVPIGDRLEVVGPAVA